MSSVIRNKRVKKAFRRTQLETMKSCDFLFLALLGIVSVYYDNLFACSSQSWNVVLRAFVILSWILIPKNVALTQFKVTDPDSAKCLSQEKNTV